MAARNEIEILVTAEVDKAIKNLDKLGKKTQGNAKKTEGTLKKLGKAWKFFGATIIGGIVVQGFTKLIKAASDAQETLSKFDTVFKDVRGEAEKTAKSLAKNFGLSSVAAKKLLGDTGDLLTGFGFTGKSALDLSKQVNELAVDLASFTNFVGGAEGASKALTKALLGERESVKSLGISILESDVKAKVFELTQKGLTFETERQAKAYATLLIAQEQSKNAIGDFQRTSTGFANQVRILRARWEDLLVSLGGIFLPLMTKIVAKIIEFTGPAQEVIDAFNEWRKSSTGLKVLFTALEIIKISIRAIIDRMLLFPRIVIQAVKNASTAFKSFAKGLKLLFKGDFKAAINEFGQSFKDATKDLFKKELENLKKSGQGIINIYKVWTGAIDLTIKKQDELKNKIVQTQDEILKAQEEFNKKRQAAEEAATIKRRKKAANEAVALITQLNDLHGELSSLTASFINSSIERDRQETDRKLQELDKKANDELQILADKHDRNLISDEEFENQSNAIKEKAETQKAAIESKARKEEARKQRAAAIAEKAASIFSIAASTAVSIGKAVAASPLTGGLPWSAINAGLGTAQIAAVLAQPLPQIPAFQDGGISEGGLAIVGEQGAELVNLPRGAEVTPAGETNEILNNNRFSVENITLPGVTNGEQFYQELQRIQQQYGALSFGS
jgi:hypothetical protein